MGKLFYSLAGEGRGHATRVKTVVDDLRQEHEITIFAPKDAYELLAPAYEGTEVKVVKIPGLFFSYTTKNRLNYLQSFVDSLRYILNFPNLVSFLRRRIRADKPDLVITDFDPALPRAAKREGVPFVSFDHQNFLRTYDLSTLPWTLRWRARFIGFFVKFFYWGQIETIVSSFYFPPLRGRHRHVKQIGVLLRREVVQAEPEEGDFIVVYLRRMISGELIDFLGRLPVKVRIYGLGEAPYQGSVSFHKTDSDSFIRDLSRSRALITTAGNQVIGESLYLRKPVLAIPEPGNFEQQINGHFLAQSGAGEAWDLEELRLDHIENFIAKIPKYRKKIRAQKIHGNPDALNLIRLHLNRAQGSKGQRQKGALIPQRKAS
jgi:uncharacterized protein (TIGR00661 family)